MNIRNSLNRVNINSVHKTLYQNESTMNRITPLVNRRTASILLAAIIFTTHAYSEENANKTPKEDFSVSELRNGYSLSQANRLHGQWTLEKFLNITESGAYSYLHLPEFLPHAMILRDGPVRDLESEPSGKVGAITLDHKGKSIRFDAMITAPESPVQGVMIMSKGKVILEKYPGMRKFDRHVWMSNAKVIAGLLIALLEKEGLVDLQKTVFHYLPAAKGTAWSDIKVFDVLNHQSGLDLEETPETRGGDTPFSAFAKSEVGLPGPDGKTLTHNEALFAIPELREPGLRFEYSSANTQMLGLIVEKVTQKRLAEVISERIWMRSGMAGDATLALTPQGNGIIHGLVSSRLDDMARFGMLFTPSWKLISEEKIISDDIVKKMQTLGAEENYLKSSQGSLGPRMLKVFRDKPLFSAYHWDAVFADGDLYKSGMHGQGLYVSPKRDFVMVWFATGASEIPMEAFSRAIAKSL